MANHCIILHTCGDLETVGISVGTTFHMKDTYCTQAYNDNIITARYNPEEDGHYTLPLYESIGMYTHLCCPMHTNGQRFGTIVFASCCIREKAFTEREKAFAQFVAQWVGSEIARDQFVTELQKSKENLSQAVEQLEKYNEDLERFDYVCSHDLQDPLRMFSDFGSLLRGVLEEVHCVEARVPKYLEHITKGAKNAQALVSALLSYARVARDPAHHIVEDIDLNILVRDIQANLSLMIVRLVC